MSTKVDFALCRRVRPWAVALLLSSGGLATSVHAQADSNCGYQINSGTYATWPGGYQAWGELANGSGETATDFEILLDLNGTQIVRGAQAQYTEVENGYRVSAPSWLQWQTIAPGASYRFQFNGAPEYTGITPYLLSVNGEACDTEPPSITLATSSRLLTAADHLTLTATAADNTAVRKVEFVRDGEVIATDFDAPFQLEVPITADSNGRQHYSTIAFDPSGNSAVSDTTSVLVAIDNKFFGTAPDQPEDYTQLQTYFDQITPGNAGKWGSVEAERDQMNWTGLDTAYNFARNNGLRFKFHTLLWGQQQPGWLGELTAEQQLEEINQWLAAVAGRYPDLEMIDVVNEPLHAPPAYKDALGGDGETGWDWLIEAFALARAHFPHSQLILNDYQILMLAPFTDDYLTLIELLQQRGLIDGIGVQAHFLERADLAVVAANLERLAATGLPIYVSELDLNFADDARQANAMRDLFTLFWQQPSVVGVTHWGYLENKMWREHAYLLRADGSERPALQWLNCTIAGGDACDALVPEYIPTGWSGDEYGLTLQAEEYDSGEEVAALGDVVAYTDAGDWIGYADVTFDSEWDTFWITYAKGNAETGSVSIHFDSPDSPPVQTLEMPPTAGWGSAATLEIPWAPLAGKRDVYLRFNDVDGVANIDNVRFGKPRPAADTSLVTDGGFEGDAISGWQSWSGATLALATDYTYAGSQSLRATDRSGAGQFAVYNLTAVVEPGSTYSVSAQALHTGAAADTLRLAAKVQCSPGTEPDGHNTYPWLQNISAAAPGEWTQLSANLEIPDCDIEDVAIFFEGTSTGVDVYLDAVQVIPPPDGNLVADGSFEGAVLAPGWSTWWTGGTDLALSSAQSADGTQSLRVSGRATNSYPSYDLSGLLDNGASYAVGTQVLHTGTEAARVSLTAKLSCSDGDRYVGLADIAAVDPGVWTEIVGTLAVPADCSPGEARIYFENTPLEVEILYIDDVSVTPL